MILFLLGSMFMIFGFAWYCFGSRKHYLAEKDHELPARPGPQPKAVPPFPFGTISDLVRDAEHRAEEEFYAQFPEERPPDFGDQPGGFAMDSSPNGIIVSNAVMTPNERRTLVGRMYDRQRAASGVMVLGEGTTYRELTASNPPKMADVGTVDKPHQRYIEGVGLITADSAHKLDRACEVVLMEKFRESEHELRALDTVIRSAKETGHRMDLAETTEKRFAAWENCKRYLDLLRELNL